MTGNHHSAAHAAEVDGDFVVFLIGTRINKPWKIGSGARWVRAMRLMLKELDANPDLGCLGHTFGCQSSCSIGAASITLKRYAKVARSPAPASLATIQQDCEPVARHRGHLHETFGSAPVLYETVLFRHAAIWLGQGWPAGAREWSTRKRQDRE